MHSITRPRPVAHGSGWLIGLLLTTFAIGTDDFVIAGILPAVARDLNVSPAATGQLVTVFSIAYAVSAPILAVVTSRLPRKPLLVGGLAVFAVINFGTALAPGYAVLMALRVLAALVAGALTPAALAIPARVAAPERVGRSIGTIAAGMTVSLVVGVPIGAWLGAASGWRSTFVAVGVLTGIAIVVVAATLPRTSAPPPAGVRARLRLLRRPAVLLCVVSTTIGACTGLMPYTYIAPITKTLTGGGTRLVAVFILIMGVSGALGTFLAGRLTDRWGIDRTLMATFGGVLLSSAGLAVTGYVTGGDAPAWLVLVFLVLWGVSAWGNNPPMNSRILRMGGDAGTEAVALNSSGQYVGVSLAGAIGGAVLTIGGGTGVLAAGTVIGVITVAVMTFAVRRHPAERPSRPGPQAVQGQVE